MATHSSILSWKIPWTGKPDGNSPQGCKELDMTEQACMIKGQGQNKQKRQLGIQISGGRIMAHYVGGGGGRITQLGVREAEGARSKCGQEVLL